MKPWLPASALALWVGTVTALAAAPQPGTPLPAPGWLSNLDEARNVARKAKKPIFLVFR